jgi:RNA polymerase sigma-70 factor (ECF subfamily)
MSQFQAMEVSPDVIGAAVNGDAAAREAIYHACSGTVYTLIRRLVSRAAIADELFQEVFVEILRSAGSYTAQGSFGGWVRAITVNKCLMYLRSPWHRRLFWLDAQQDDEESQPLTLVDAAPQPDAQAAASVDLERALGQLPAVTRSVVWLHDVEGYTHQEIATLLGRTPSFSKSQLARAHVRLRELLEPQVESLPCTPIPNNC